jgi:mono/diheme cytochrome c family protein
MNRQFTFAVVTVCLVFAAILNLSAQPAGAVATAPIYVPDFTHANDPMPDGVIEWDATQKSVDATNGQEMAWFAFAFTNVATRVEITLVTNITVSTGFTTVTNHSFWSRISGNRYASVPVAVHTTNTVTITNSSAPTSLAILDAHASCGCTQPQLPSKPWLLAPGTNGVLRISVDLHGKNGMLVKWVDVTTERGQKKLTLQINIAPPPPVQPLSEEERARGIAMSKLDRQAVFKGDCVSCHAKEVKGKYGQQLFAQVCAVCHESSPRATMVPDLHQLKEPTSEEFWRTWITSGKAGTLMPAFASSQGGPLDDMQIASLASWLNAVIPPKPAPPSAK